MIRKRLPEEVHAEVFALVVKMASGKDLLNGKTIAIDATTLEANAAMKSIVRRDTGADWNDYVRALAKGAGIEEPTDEDLRRFDRKRKKKASNADWTSTTDPSSRITKMKDGRTHLAYKAEHAIDVESEIIVSATIHQADQADSKTSPDTLMEAQAILVAAEHEQAIEEVVADKGYHSKAHLLWLHERDIRSYIPERKSAQKQKWSDKPAEMEAAFRGNRRRVKGSRSKALQRLRSERVERSFAHTCVTGAARRTWLRGVLDIQKRYLIHVAAFNLGTILRTLFGFGTPRGLAQGGQRAASACFGVIVAAYLVIARVCNLPKAAATSRRKNRHENERRVCKSLRSRIQPFRPRQPAFSTAC